MQSINTVDYPTFSCKSWCGIVFSTDTWYLRLKEICMQALVSLSPSLPPPPLPPLPPPSLSPSLSLSLSTTCLLSKFANSLDPEDLRPLAKPNQGQTDILRINNVSERPTLRPMPWTNIIEPWHEISNIVVCGTSKASDQPAHMHSLIRAFASRLNILWVLSYWLNTVLKRRLHRLFCVYTRQNATLCCGSIYDILASSRCVRYAGYMHISKKRKNSDKYHQSSFSYMQCAVSGSSSLKSFF